MKIWKKMKNENMKKMQIWNKWSSGEIECSEWALLNLSPEKKIWKKIKSLNDLCKINNLSLTKISPDIGCAMKLSNFQFPNFI
jgi:hypothetical protein